MQQTHSYRHLFVSVIIYIYMPLLSSILFSYLMNYTATLKTQDSKLSFWHLFWYEDCRAGIAKSDERPTVVRQSCLWTSSRLIRWLNLQNSFFFHWRRLLACCPEATYPLPVCVWGVSRFYSAGLFFIFLLLQALTPQGTASNYPNSVIKK